MPPAGAIPIETHAVAPDLRATRSLGYWVARTLHTALLVLLSPAILLVLVVGVLFLGAVSIVQWIESLAA